MAHAVRARPRWGFWMRSVPGRRGQVKAGDIPLATTPRDDVLRWLGADAEYQSALCVQAVAWLLHTGWSMPALRGLVDQLQAHGFMNRVVERVHGRATQREYGPARVGRYNFGGTVEVEPSRARIGTFTIEEDT